MQQTQDFKAEQMERMIVVESLVQPQQEVRRCWSPQREKSSRGDVIGKDLECLFNSSVSLSNHVIYLK